MKSTVVVFANVNQTVVMSFFSIEDKGEWNQLIQSINNAKGSKDEESTIYARPV